MYCPASRLALLLSLTLAGAGLSPNAASAALTSGSRVELATRIDTLIGQPRFQAASWGIAVVSLDSGRTLYSHDADHLFQPASTTKLFTAALTLDTLGADLHTATRMLARGAVRRNRLDGTLVLYGMGDPTLGTIESSPDWADRLAGQLVAHGIRRIHGDLVADDSYFAGPLAGSGWEVGDLLSWFAVPSSALSVQENISRLTVTPAARAGGVADVSLKPALGIPALISRVTTTAPGTPSDVNLFRAPGSDTLDAFGSLPAGSAATFQLAMADPARVAGEMLRTALEAHGVKLDGRVRVLHWPEDDAGVIDGATLLGEITSPSMAEILHRGLKRSQNLYLQNLLLMAGIRARSVALQSADPPTAFLTTEAWGIRALRELQDRIGIAPGQAMIEEGSGLSRQDLVTPNAMVRLLQFLAVQPYAVTLRDALPLAGIDGSLTGRMRGTLAEGNVRAKTGSMTFVSCLAGYVTSARGEHLAFAIMLNNYAPPEDGPAASRDVDAIAELLAGYRGKD